MDIHTTAGLLLLLRLVSSAIFLYIIFKITYPNLKAENDPQVKSVRLVLFLFSIALLVHNIIPIIVDAGTLLTVVERSSSVINTAGIIYTFNNAISSVVFALAWLFLFIVSGQVTVRLQAANKRNTTLQGQNDEYHRQDVERNK